MPSSDIFGAILLGDAGTNICLLKKGLLVGIKCLGIGGSYILCKFLIEKAVVVAAVGSTA
jgi:hypothetical protein